MQVDWSLWRLRGTQFAFVIVVALDLACFVTSLQPSFLLVQRPCDGALDANCGTWQLSPEAWSALKAHGTTPAAYATYAVAVTLLGSLAYFGVGFLIAWRRWRDVAALFIAAVFINSASTSMADALTTGTQGIVALEGVRGALTAASFPAVSVFILIFPTGRFAPRWTALIVPLWGAMSVLSALNAPVAAQVAAAMAIQGACILVQVYRYARVYTPLQRQQTKWVVFGLAIAFSILLLANLPPLIWSSLARPGSLYNSVAIGFLTLTPVAIPVGVAVAILRWRLYDIDLIIKRTVTYGLVTALLASVYVVIVFGGQRTLLAITGADEQPAPVTIALATLLVAALFQPARRWAQFALDRRFYRRAYDARLTLERFSRGLREEVDLPTLRQRLTGVVEDTVEPEHVSLWLREPAHR